MPTISISQETHDLLKELAIPFVDKTEEDVIVRHLRNADSRLAKTGTNVAKPADLISHAGRIPHGSKLRATYKGLEYHAEVRDGIIVWNGREFGSISKAAVAIIQSTGSNRPTENGWRFFEVKTPDASSWRPGTELRYN